jgi:hypothetical protein
MHAHQVQARRGTEAQVRQIAPEPTALSFPGSRAAKAEAGVGGFTQGHLKPGASAEWGVVSVQVKAVLLSESPWRRPLDYWLDLSFTKT